MASELLANNFATQLAVGCAPGDATIQVAAAAPAALQGGQFRILVDSEYMIVTGGQSGTTWNVTRGVEGSAAAQHLQGVWVTHLLTAGALFGGNLASVVSDSSADATSPIISASVRGGTGKAFRDFPLITDWPNIHTDGTACGAALQAAITARGPGLLRWPGGSGVAFGSDLSAGLVPPDGQHWVGEGWGGTGAGTDPAASPASTVKYVGANGGTLLAAGALSNGVNGFGIEDLVLDMNNTCQIGIHAVEMQWSTIRRVFVTNGGMVNTPTGAQTAGIALVMEGTSNANSMHFVVDQFGCRAGGGIRLNGVVGTHDVCISSFRELSILFGVGIGQTLWDGSAAHGIDLRETDNVTWQHIYCFKSFGANVWVSTTSYSTGNQVSWRGFVYTSLANGNVGNAPDLTPGSWSVTTSLANYGVVFEPGARNHDFEHCAPDSVWAQTPRTSVWGNRMGMYHRGDSTPAPVLEPPNGSLPQLTWQEEGVSSTGWYLRNPIFVEGAQSPVEPGRNRVYRALADRGFIFESDNIDTLATTTGTSPALGTAYARLAHLLQGDTTVKIACAVSTGGSGTNPTLVKMALVDATTNKLLIATANLNADAQLQSQGIAEFALAYTVLADGPYWVSFLLATAGFGTTAMKLGQGGTGPIAAAQRRSGKPGKAALLGTALTDYPAVGTVMTVTYPGGGAVIPYYMALTNS